MAFSVIYGRMGYGNRHDQQGDFRRASGANHHVDCLGCAFGSYAGIQVCQTILDGMPVEGD